MFSRKKMEERFHQPMLGLDDEGKLRWIANAGYSDIFPRDFANDTECTLIGILARYVFALEARVKELENA